MHSAQYCVHMYATAGFVESTYACPGINLNARLGDFVKTAASAVSPHGVDILDAGFMCFLACSIYSSALWSHDDRADLTMTLKLVVVRCCANAKVVAWNVLISELGEAPWWLGLVLLHARLKK